MISYGIVPSNSLSPVSTAESMVTIAVTVLEAGRAGALLVIDWATQAVFAGHDELGRLKVQTQGRDGGTKQPSTSTRKAKRSKSCHLTHSSTLLHLNFEI